MQGVDKHIVDGNKPLFVAFGGIAQQLSMPPFEFKNFLTNNFGDVNFVFIRDMEQAWYYKGIRGLSTDFESNIKGIKEIIDPIDKTKTIFLGNSMGGYASILYGVHLNVDHVLAFAPQTFINPNKRAEFKDARWPNQMKVVHSQTAENQKGFFDLQSLNNLEYSTVIDIFCGKESVLDTIHANNMVEVKNSRINIEPNGGHGVIKELKKNGKLTEIIEGILNG